MSLGGGRAWGEEAESRFLRRRALGSRTSGSQPRSHSRRLLGGASNGARLGNEVRRGLAPGFDLSHLRGGREASEEPRGVSGPAGQ